MPNAAGPARVAPSARPAHIARMDKLSDIEWRVSPGLTPYEEAVAEMEARAEAVAAGRAPELIWLLEHPPVYTAGTSASGADVIDPRFPVVRTGRGGKHTYHGPGQRIGYLVLNLNERGRDVRCYVHALEAWVIAALARSGVQAFAAPGRVGIWTLDGGREAKIGAIGVRVKRWVTLHGFSVNVAPDLSHFDGIVPCGISEYGVTSLAALGVAADPATLDMDLALTVTAFLDTLSCPRQKEA
jgi:lipoyl(octanoyl) transferase